MAARSGCSTLHFARVTLLINRPRAKAGCLHSRFWADVGAALGYLQRFSHTVSM